MERNFWVPTNMSDHLTAQQRSRNMAKIRSSGNASTEIRLLQILRRNHIAGWRRNQSIIGRPDFVFPQERLAIFVDGCFWHGCAQCSSLPSSNAKYWIEKRVRNKTRDRIVTKELRQKGWIVLRIWEHSLKSEPRTKKRITAALARSASRPARELRSG